ncbi:MAG TPA: glutamate synthase subunit beta [Pseudonocardiaceae bacterium]
MADPHGFLDHCRCEAARRPVDVRVRDWREVYAEVPVQQCRSEVADQAARCMDCGIPFCHTTSAGCPLGNLIPEWNDLVRLDQWEQAAERLHATNNFPEFTGRLCPAPCETACVLAITPRQSGGAVTIKRIEQAIVDTAWATGRVTPVGPAQRTGHRIAVVGSGPGGLAAAQQLTRAGHEVTVFERDDRIGGLLRYGIPEFKMAKAVLDRRIGQLRDEGTGFVTGCEVGRDLPTAQLRARFAATVLAVGALQDRDVAVPGRDLPGVHLAMEHLVGANRACEGDGPAPVNAAGRHVVIIGGGDTAADCLGTAHRQGAASVTQLDLYPRPPAERDETRSPWPTWPVVLHTYPAHEEGGRRRFAVAVQEFLGDHERGVQAVALREVRVRKDGAGLRTVTPVSDAVLELPCDLALLAIGFDGVRPMPLLDDLGLRRGAHGTLGCGPDWQTGAPGVFVCGDAHRGASLVVWAIAEGRAAAHAVDAALRGTSALPAPVRPDAVPLRA